MKNKPPDPPMRLHREACGQFREEQEKGRKKKGKTPGSARCLAFPHPEGRCVCVVAALAVERKKPLATAFTVWDRLPYGIERMSKGPHVCRRRSHSVQTCA